MSETSISLSGSLFDMHGAHSITTADIGTVLSARELIKHDFGSLTVDIATLFVCKCVSVSMVFVALRPSVRMWEFSNALDGVRADAAE